MYAVPENIQTRVFARLPDALRITDRKTSWVEARQHVRPHSFLEGPSIDRNGNLYCTDIPYGRIFKVTPDGTFHLVTEYDGEPNGLKIHQDGRLFVTDHKRGIIAVDPDTGAITPIMERAYSEGFRGVNDLCFARNGDLYFTDQGQTGLQDPSGKVYKLHNDGRLSCLISGIPSPNGLVLNREETMLFVNVTRANAVWRLPLLPHDRVAKAGVFLNLSGGLSGPDGIAVDAEGNVAVAHTGLGTIWLFSRLGEPLYRVRSCAGLKTTNIAYGGPDNKTLFITESESGSILAADMPVAGHPMYSHT
ncbi:gluconolactonase [Agaricicola taiwanensis]|uniref:Gluconolactonase n=1 Tax=Agaricicola taiwanensis TaxID=591372 RepID=A0A8J2YF51_9RHOB|nr:SMP-30/gluconolactonase/LRE family protein [Agaricicola taiwanensis]GGE28420.1 gluconolactonase [Agaricicola taiwanensis]